MIDTLLLYLKSYFEGTITRSFLNTYSSVILTLKEHYIALPASLFCHLSEGFQSVLLPALTFEILYIHEHMTSFINGPPVSCVGRPAGRADG